ncbi:unnamed protein product [Blepharisma stoltei]|uniref:Uncharacterized protein n=1 Tax=Blepharisma stoltei TaxID=1481888 RepID=A0AAU9JVQ3_9CILI|nr:unnamed protein product [Blepharisma stoltei]
MKKKFYKNKKIQILESRMFQDMIRPLCTILFIEASDNLTDPKKWLKITHSPLRKNNVLPVQVEEEIIIPKSKKIVRKNNKKKFWIHQHFRNWKRRSITKTIKKCYDRKRYYYLRNSRNLIKR